MNCYTLHQEQVVPRPLEDVFPFFACPENLQTLTPPSLSMEVLTPAPLRMAEGALFDYCITTNGLPMRWTTLITEYDPPHRFVDVQLRGPYSFWHHTHTFEPTEGGVKLVDTVRYAMPFGPLGTLVHRLIVRRQLRQIFAFRRAYIAEKWGQQSMADEVPQGLAGQADT